MSNKSIAFDDFVDECFLDDDSLCDYQGRELDQVVESLLSIDKNDWVAFQDLAA